jgi:hypothetical protein
MLSWKTTWMCPGTRCVCAFMCSAPSTALCVDIPSRRAPVPTSCSSIENWESSIHHSSIHYQSSNHASLWRLHSGVHTLTYIYIVVIERECGNQFTELQLTNARFLAA